MFIKKDKLVDLLLKVAVESYKQCGRNLSGTQLLKVKNAIINSIDKKGK